MLRMRALLLIVALSFCGYTWSDEPVKCKATQQNSCSEQRGTEQSPLFVKPTSPTTQPERDYEHYEKIEKPESERRITNATIALAVITFFLAVFTGLLWLATRQLVKDTNRTNELTTKAYIGVEHAFIYLQQNGRDFLAHIVFKNTGRTPAYSVNSMTNLGIYDLNNFEIDPNKFSKINKIDSRGILGAESSMEVKIHLASDDIDKIKIGSLNFSIWGKIDYLDVFYNPRYVNFMVINGDFDEARKGWPLQAYKEGNDAN